MDHFLVSSYCISAQPGYFNHGQTNKVSLSHHLIGHLVHQQEYDSDGLTRLHFEVCMSDDIPSAFLGDKLHGFVNEPEPSSHHPKPRRRLRDSARDKADGLDVLIQKTKAISIVPDEVPSVI